MKSFLRFSLAAAALAIGLLAFGSPDAHAQPAPNETTFAASDFATFTPSVDDKGVTKFDVVDFVTLDRRGGQALALLALCVLGACLPRRHLLIVTLALAVAVPLALGLYALALHLGWFAAFAAFLALNSAFMPKPGALLRAHTAIADLWVPSIWMPGLAERLTKRKSLINSGILLPDERFTEVANGPGTKAEIPFLKEPDIADAIQAENSDLTISNLVAGSQVCTILNRRMGVGATALSRAVTGTEDPVTAALNFITDIRLRNRQATLLSQLRGVFGFAAAPGAGAAAFKPLRRDIFSETGAAPTSEKLFSSDEYIKTLGLFGETMDDLEGFRIVCHSDIGTAMLLQDDIAFIEDSQGKKIVTHYKGAQVFYSDLLVRAGGVSGKVYDIYVFRPGSVAYGEKKQSNQVGEVATFYKIEDQSKNNVGFADYTRFVMHPQGATWKGVPAGQSATNAELATEGNWELALADVKNVRIACLRTNG